MRYLFSKCFVRSYRELSSSVQRKFEKQLSFLLRDLRHPSLHAKKYNEERNIWQARLNRNYRFYFLIESDTYILLGIKAHPE